MSAPPDRERLTEARDWLRRQRNEGSYRDERFGVLLAAVTKLLAWRPASDEELERSAECDADRCVVYGEDRIDHVANYLTGWRAGERRIFAALGLESEATK